MNEFLIAIILGIVEGITEFLPISSTGHLILVNEFINFKGDFVKTFDVVIQLGAILSVVVYFWHKLFPFSSKKSLDEKTQTWNLWFKTIAGVTPTIIIAFLFKDIIQDHFFNSYIVAVMLILWGIVLVLIEGKQKKSSINSISDLSYKTAITVGLIQSLAMVPGTSRSAVTIIGAMLLGASRTVAAEFSFFLAIPMMAAASGYSLLKSGSSMSPTEIQLLAVGFIVSFLVAWLVIAGFMKYISKRDFKVFGYYRIVLGLLVLGYFSFMR